MPAMTLSAKLDRSDGSTPWGFRLQGGKDFSAPLTIQRVTPGSLADKCGLKPGDILTKIGGTSVEQYRHKDAQHAILTAGNSLELTLTRGAAPFVQQSYSPAPAQPAPAASFPAYQPKPAQPSFQAKQNYNPSPKPFIAGGSNVPTVVNKQYNTPINVYSVDNVMDTLAGQTQAMGIQAEPPSAGAQPPWRSHQPAAAPAPVAAPAAPSYGSPAQHAAAVPRSAPFKPSMPAPGPVAKPAPVRVGAWQPKIPTGPRNPVFGKRGDAKSMGPAVGRVPVCSGCGSTIRGPFVLALDMSWCPDHFMCANPNCRQSLVESGFVEEGGQLFCERDYEQFFAPRCAKCNKAIIGDCVNALQKTFHPHCFVCAHCRQPIGKGSFHIEDGQQYCDKDWQAMFQTKCQGCQFPIEPGDKWVEALNANWHSECFNCSTCQVNLEGQAFFAKGGHPYCKRHASGGRF